MEAEKYFKKAIRFDNQKIIVDAADLPGDIKEVVEEKGG